MTNIIDGYDLDLDTTYYIDSTVAAPANRLTVVDYYREAFLSTKIRIRSLEELPPNWDGEGAEPVSTEAIQRAVGYIADLQDEAKLTTAPDGWILEWPVPHVSATRDGGIALSWLQDNYWAMIEIIPGEEDVLFTRGQNGEIPESDYKSLAQVKSEFMPAKITPIQDDDQYGSILKWLG